MRTRTRSPRRNDGTRNDGARGAMTARQCCGARGRRLGDERTRARAVLGSERLGDERTQRPDFWLLPPTRRRKWRRGEQLHAADRGCCQWLLPAPRRLHFALPPLGSRPCRRGEHLHAPAQYGASLPSALPVPPRRVLSTPPSSARGIGRPVEEPRAKTRAVFKSLSAAEQGSRICMQVLITAPSILFSLSGLIALERVRGS